MILHLAYKYTLKHTIARPFIYPRALPGGGEGYKQDF